VNGSPPPDSFSGPVLLLPVLSCCIHFPFYFSSTNVPIESTLPPPHLTLLLHEEQTENAPPPFTSVPQGVASLSAPLISCTNASCVRMFANERIHKDPSPPHFPEQAGPRDSLSSFPCPVLRCKYPLTPLLTDTDSSPPYVVPRHARPSGPGGAAQCLASFYPPFFSGKFLHGLSDNSVSCPPTIHSSKPSNVVLRTSRKVLSTVPESLSHPPSFRNAQQPC